MSSLPRSSRAIHFHSDSWLDDETVTAVARPELKRFVNEYRTHARRQPKARTTAEVALPSVIVAEEPPTQQARRALAREQGATVIMARPVFARRRSDVRTAIVTGVMVVVVTVLVAAFLPLFKSLFVAARSALGG